MPTEPARADHEAMLIVGTFVTAQADPAVWERFVNRLYDQWQTQDAATRADRAAAATTALAAFGNITQSRGGVANPGITPTDIDATPPAKPGGGA